MIISNIFAMSKKFEKVFSIQYNEDSEDIFNEVFDNWRDSSYLFDFFHDNITDLHDPFWTKKFKKELTVEDAIEITKTHANNFLRELINIARQNTSDFDSPNNLLGNFSSLLQNPYGPLENSLKCYGFNNPSWLRLYAVQIEDTIIITGGAIKLKNPMEIREHTNLELNKMQEVISLLKRQHFTENVCFDSIKIEF